MIETMILIVSISSVVMIIGITAFVSMKYLSIVKEREKMRKPYLNAVQHDAQER